MSQHTIFSEAFEPTDESLTITGDEARHAIGAKRLREGSPVTILNGRGVVAEAQVESSARSQLRLGIISVRQAPPVSPAVRIIAAVPKGPRAADLVDALSQVGASSWTPLATDRSAVEPRSVRIDRLRRVAIESAKQCGRAWLLQIEEPVHFEDAIQAENGPLLIADMSGSVCSQPTGAASIRVLIGPEGGWTSTELDAARKAGAVKVSFGPHVMRIETAAAVAASMILGVERARGATQE